MDPTKTDLDSVGGAIALALQAESHASAEIRLARGSFLDAVASRKPATVRPARRFQLRLAFVGALAFSGGLGAYFWMKAPISFDVGVARTKGRLGDVVEPLGADPVPMHFSEGSKIQVAPHGRLRVLSASSKGARVLVERGDVEVEIAHPGRRAKRWDFEAGPFEVRVTGTRFHMFFEPQRQTLHLAMREGQVVVTAPCLAGPRVVSAGGRLDLSCQPAELVPPPSVEAGSEARRPELSGAPGQAKARWRDLLAMGRMAEALRLADQAGLERVCQVATAKELLQLGDAARLGHRGNKAALILRILRQRFPRSNEAATAAFALGRISFEDRRAYNEAAGYFSTYLAEEPQGPLMGDALGRLMESRQKAGNLPAAKAEAEKYARRFPTGPYADLARVILSR
jgi:hypothetical protein